MEPKVTGKLTAIDGDSFQVKTAYGEIKIPRSDVITITFPENQPRKESSEGSNVASAVDESLDGTTYTNHTANFEVTVPTGWTVSQKLRESSKDLVAALQSPDATLFLLVTPEQFAGSLATYRVLVETQAQNKFKDYERLGESDARLDGRSGVRLIFRARIADSNAPMKFMVYVIPYEGRMVRLTFFTLEPLFADAVSTFEKIAGSYHTIRTGALRETEASASKTSVNSLGLPRHVIH